MADASNTRTIDAEKTVEAEKTGDAFVENVDQAARIANQDEHDVGAIKAIKMYPWTLAWCCYAVWMIILNSFENQAGGSVLGIPQFRKDFGYKFGDTYVLHVQWQSAFSGAPVAS
jgi:SP family general alpha glucoside:H+ symporter-like MFS transporter